MSDFSIGAVTLDSGDYKALAQFYAALLDGKTVVDNDHYIQLEMPDGWHLFFQKAEGYVPPTWPEEPGKPQQMIHLDIMVKDLKSAVAKAEKLGATKSEKQFIPENVVMKDPAGHPFCLIPTE